MAPNIVRHAGTCAPEEGGWIGVKVVCDCVSKASKQSDGDVAGEEREEG